MPEGKKEVVIDYDRYQKEKEEINIALKGKVIHDFKKGIEKDFEELTALLNPKGTAIEGMHPIEREQKINTIKTKHDWLYQLFLNL